MYAEFFNLKAKPFELVPNPRFLYPSDSHRKALNYLEYGLKSRAGFILLTGEVGSGKTTIIKDLIRRLGAATTMAMIFNTKVTPKQLIAMINEEFGLEVSGKDKVELLRDLNNFLIDQYAANGQPIIIIDEAQNLSGETLEEIRLLSNLEADQAKLVQIVLVGQPELKEIIDLPSLRQLKQRISVNFHITPLTREETEEYIFHRLEVAGNRNAVVFRSGVIDIIFAHSGGVPRLINVFCDFLLLAAFAEQTHDVTLVLANEVAGDLVPLTPPAESSDAPSKPAEREVDGRELDGRFLQLEESIASLRLDYEEKNRLFQRICVHENVLKLMASKQQESFGKFMKGMNDIAAQLTELRKDVARLPRGEAVEQASATKQMPKSFIEKILGW